MEYITESATETQKLAYKFADTLKAKTDKGIVIALSGDLGAGKTTFVQGLAKALGIEQRLVSPTFVLMRRYPLEKEGILYHLDAYRIDKNEKEEVENLGLSEIWDEKGNIVIIEWAEKVKKYLPEDTIWINFEYIGEDKRRIVSTSL
jgi:tRNA threonylcarbamoyladenosine biosynthesis protein TsaE